MFICQECILMLQIDVSMQCLYVKNVYLSYKLLFQCNVYMSRMYSNATNCCFNAMFICQECILMLQIVVSIVTAHSSFASETTKRVYT